MSPEISGSAVSSPGFSRGVPAGADAADPLLAGDKARESGDLEAAISLYCRAVGSDGASWRGWAGLAECYNRRQLPLQAKKAAARTVKLNPKSASGWRVLAELKLKERRTTEALNLAGLAVKLAPCSHEAQHVLAKACLQGGLEGEARQALRRTVELSPGFFPAHLDLFRLAVKSGTPGRMLLSARQALARCPEAGLAQLIAGLGSVIFEEDRSARPEAVARFEALFSRLLKAGGLACPPGYYKALAKWRLARGELPQALAAFGKMMRNGAGGREPDADVFRAYCCLGSYRLAFETGEALVRKHEVQVAEFCNPWINDRIAPAWFWKKQYRILSGSRVPENLGTWKLFYLAALQLFSGGGDGPRRFAEIRRKLTGRYAWMRFPAACKCLDGCDWGLAAKEFALIVKAVPYDWFARCKNAEALLCAGREKEAFGEFEAAFRLKENARDSIGAWKGEMYLMTGSYGKALKSLEAAAALSSVFAPCWLGAAYFKTGRIKTAAACLERCIENDPVDDEAKLWRAELHRVSGEFRKALGLLDLILEKRPDYDFARFNRALIHHAKKDYARMREDFRLIDPELTGIISARLGAGAPGALSEEGMAKLLLRGLEMAKGNRRMDKYLYKIQFPEYRGRFVRGFGR